MWINMKVQRSKWIWNSAQYMRRISDLSKTRAEAGTRNIRPAALWIWIFWERPKSVVHQKLNLKPNSVHQISEFVLRNIYILFLYESPKVSHFWIWIDCSEVESKTQLSISAFWVCIEKYIHCSYMRVQCRTDQRCVDVWTIRSPHNDDDNLHSTFDYEIE